MHICFLLQLVNAGEDVLVFYNDRASFQTLVQMMRSERDRMDENSPLMYHIHLVELLAVCTEGKNVYTEIKCNSLLPLDDIVRVVTHEDCIPEVRTADAEGLAMNSCKALCRHRLIKVILIASHFHILIIN